MQPPPRTPLPLDVTLARVDWAGVKLARGPATAVPDLLRTARGAATLEACLAPLAEVAKAFLHDGKVEGSFPLLVEPLFALAGERREAAVRAAVVRIARTALVAARGATGLGQGAPWVPSDRLAPVGVAVAMAIREHGPSLRHALAPSSTEPLRADEVSLAGLLGLDGDVARALGERLLKVVDRVELSVSVVALATAPFESRRHLRHAIRWLASSDPDPLVRTCALASRRVLEDTLADHEIDALLRGLEVPPVAPDAFPPCGGSVARVALEAVLMRGFDPETWPDLFARIGARASAEPADALDAQRALVASAVLGVDPVDRADPKPGSLSEPAKRLVAELVEKHPAVLRRLGLDHLVEPKAGGPAPHIPQ